MTPVPASLGNRRVQRFPFLIVYLSKHEIVHSYYVILNSVLSKLQIVQLYLAGLEESLNYNYQKILELEELGVIRTTVSPT